MKKVNCPQCKNTVEWKEGDVYKPFCSKRCQLLDLGSSLFDSEKDLEEIIKH